jgi:hypothetical protein
LPKTGLKICFFVNSQKRPNGNPGYSTSCFN